MSKAVEDSIDTMQETDQKIADLTSEISALKAKNANLQSENEMLKLELQRLRALSTNLMTRK